MGQPQQPMYGGQPPVNFSTFVPPGVSPEMMGLAAQAGKGTLDSMVNRVTPGMSQFWAAMRLRMAVSNSFVSKKISLVLFPFRNKTWVRLNADDGNNGTLYKKALPKDDVNAPDLYLPVMAFVTYVLMIAYLRGTANQFTPEDIINAVWRCLLLHVVEASIIKLGVNMISSTSLPFIDIVCYTGYKYLGLCGTAGGTVFGGWLATLSKVFTVYQAAALFFFLVKTFSAVIPKGERETIPPRWAVIAAFAAGEAIVSLFLAWV